MAGWQIGLVIMMAVGVAVILFGALWDRERNRRRAEQLTSPPDRPIPGFAGDAPVYVTDHSHAPGGQHPLSEAERSALAVRVQSLPGFAARLADGRFVSDPGSGWAIAERPLVLVCADPVGSLREILPLVDRAAATKTPLVVAAPSFDPETLATLVANHLHRTLRIVAVTAEPAALDAVAAGTGAIVVSRTDRQAGWIPEASIGTATTWVSAPDRAWAL